VAGPAAMATSSPGRREGSRTVLPGQSPDGLHILAVLVKRSYRIIPGGPCTRAEDDCPLVSGDVFWEDPMTSSVRHESDLVPFKLATDVVLNGTAYAPGGRASQTFPISLQIGTRRKVIQVVGDRRASYADGGPPVITEPSQIMSMELRYERAYGGTDVYSDARTPYPYPRNPLGRGFVVANTSNSLKDIALPNLEDPSSPLAAVPLCLGEYVQWPSCPLPAGLGWFPKVWRPRAELAGILPLDRPVEQQLRQAYAKLLPADLRGPYLKHGLRDMDFRFFNGASEGLAFPFLQGGETITTENLSPDGTVTFELPAERPHVGLDIGDGIQEPEVVMQTVMIRMEDQALDLVWRGAVAYRGPDWLPEMRKMEVLID
jgi:hypothetical protein